MNSQAIQNKLNEYYNTATPEQVVKEFEDLGVKFVKTENMNLIQQLQTTPKWKEFKEWYNAQGYFIPLDGVYQLHRTFIEFPLEFTKGVFEKFIESQGFFIEQWYKTSMKQMYMCLFKDTQTESIFEGTFEELLIWYFNN